MAKPKLINLARLRGDTYGFSFTVGADLTGYTVVLTVDTREFPSDDSTMQFQLTGEVSEATASSSTLSFGPLTEEQADLIPRTYYYDVQATAGAVVRTPNRGQWLVEQDITK